MGWNRFLFPETQIILLLIYCCLPRLRRTCISFPSLTEYFWIESISILRKERKTSFSFLLLPSQIIAPWLNFKRKSGGKGCQKRGCSHRWAPFLSLNCFPYLGTEFLSRATPYITASQCLFKSRYNTGRLMKIAKIHVSSVFTQRNQMLSEPYQLPIPNTSKLGDCRNRQQIIWWLHAPNTQLESKCFHTVHKHHLCADLIPQSVHSWVLPDALFPFSLSLVQLQQSMSFSWGREGEKKEGKGGDLMFLC